jgi:prolipoprotein diacylglyceryltransferase
VTFPVFFHFGSFSVRAHEVMETAGYVAGIGTFLVLHHRWRRPDAPPPSDNAMLALLVGALLGALIGSRGLAVVELWHEYIPLRPGMEIGKTIVGGLAGAWLGVEIVKRILGRTQSTGDIFVFPILFGICLGRVGCFLEGLDDLTYGTATRLPWGVDFGDGIHRHPTQLYEIAFCAILGIAIRLRMRRPWANGELFRLFMIGYFSWRLAVEFIKPHNPADLFAGLSAIQITSAVTAIAATISLIRIRRRDAVHRALIGIGATLPIPAHES